MKHFFTLIILLLSLNVFATERVLILTSLEQPEKRLITLSKNRSDFFRGVENIAKNILKKDYEIEVIHGVDPYQLYKSVSSGSYKAIFWISHANKGSDLGNGMASDDIIVDKNGINVKDIFYHLNPSTQYLSLIGCYSSFFTKDLRKNFSKTGRPHTVVTGFDRKIDILKGLRKSLRDFKNRSFFTENSLQDNYTPKINLEISRQSSDKGLPPLFIFNRNKLLRVLPGLHANSRETYDVDIEDVKTVNDLKIVISTEKLLLESISSEDFGDMDISSSIEAYGKFKLLTVGEKPLGTRTRIFKYQGSLPQ